MWNAILEGAANSSALEITAVIFGLLSVWLAMRENILLYPAGIISVVIYIYICAVFKLYADMGINIYYLIISIYGWYYWNPGKEQDRVPIQHVSKREWGKGIGILAVSFGIIAFVLLNFTDSDVPYYDATTTAIFIVSMIWMAEKKIEHWWGWILGDALSIPLYWYKGLAFTSFQYLVFTVLAVAGYIQWKKKIDP